MELKGSKTEKNLWEAFAGDPKLEISILIIGLVRLKRKVMSKLLEFFLKQLSMKKNMQREPQIFKYD